MNIKDYDQVGFRIQNALMNHNDVHHRGVGVMAHGAAGKEFANAMKNKSNDTSISMPEDSPCWLTPEYCPKVRVLEELLAKHRLPPGSAIPYRQCGKDRVIISRSDFDRLIKQ